MKFIRKIVQRWIDESLKEHEVYVDRLVTSSVKTVTERIGYIHEVGESVAFELDVYRFENGKQWVERETKEGLIIERKRHVSPHAIAEIYSVWVEDEKRTYNDVTVCVDHRGFVELIHID